MVATAEVHPICKEMASNLATRAWNPDVFDIPESDYLFTSARFMARDTSKPESAYNESELGEIVNDMAGIVFERMGKPFPFEKPLRASDVSRVTGQSNQAGWFYVRTDYQWGHDVYQRHGFGLLMKVDPNQRHPISIIRPTFAFPASPKEGASNPGGYPAARSLRAMMANFVAGSVELGNLMVSKKTDGSPSEFEMPTNLEDFASSIGNEDFYRPSHISVNATKGKREKIERRFSFFWGSEEAFGVDSVVTYRRGRDGQYRLEKIEMGDVFQRSPQEVVLSVEQIPATVKLLTESLRRLVREQEFAGRRSRQGGDGDIRISGPTTIGPNAFTYRAEITSESGRTVGFIFEFQTDAIPFLRRVDVIR